MHDLYMWETIQIAATATGNGTALPVTASRDGPFSTFVAQVTGTFTATVTFEATLGESATQASNTWVAIPMRNVTTGAVATTTTAAGVFRGNCSGYRYVRARVTWTSGTSVTVLATLVPLAVDDALLSSGVLGTVIVSSSSGQYAEDAPHTTGDIGVPALVVRQDTATALGANNDYSIAAVDASNRLWVHVGAIDAGATNIGDVDVLTLPDELSGPGSPVIDSYTSAKVDLAASTADQVLVAAPGASKQIWVYGLFMMADTAAGTVQLEDEDNTEYTGTMAVSDEGGWVLPLSGNFAMPWIKVASNKALEADTGACTVDGVIAYAIVSV